MESIIRLGLTCILCMLVGVAGSLAIPAFGEEEGTTTEQDVEENASATEDLEEDDFDDSESELDDDIEVIEIESEKGTGLKDVPISVKSFSAEDLDTLRIGSIADLAAFTPNLEINTAFAASSPTIFIRGIGLKDYTALSAGSVAVYQDGVRINASAGQLFGMFDTRKVGVLRGPQVAVHGRNATSGAIEFMSYQPDGEWSAWGSIDYGNYEAMSFSGALGFPIVEDLLSGRFAFFYEQSEGQVHNECADWDPAFVGEDNLSAANIEKVYWEKKPDIPDFVLKKNFFGTQRLGLTPDFHCVIGPPGSVITPVGEANGFGPEGSIRTENVAVVTQEDFAGLDRTPGDTQSWGTRLMLLFQPTDTMEWLFNAHGGQILGDAGAGETISTQNNTATLSDDGQDQVRKIGYKQQQNSQSWSELNTYEGSSTHPLSSRDLPIGLTEKNGVGQGADGGDPFRVWVDKQGKELLNLYGASLTGNWDLDSFRVTSISGYEYYDRSIDGDSDGCPCLLYDNFQNDSAWQLTQEIRLEGDGEAYTWIAGGEFIFEDLDSFILYPSIVGSKETTQAFEQQLWAWAPYGEARWDITDWLSAIGSARYNYEHKIFTLQSKIISGTGVHTVLPEQTNTGDWRGFSWGGTIEVIPYFDSTTLYAKYTRARKAGHFNAGITIAPRRCKQPDPRDCPGEQSLESVEPEFIHSVEFGVRSRWFDGLLNLNAAIFRYWYSDLQVYDVVNEKGQAPTEQLLNADADVKGAEVSVEVTPFPGADLEFNGGYLDTAFREFVVKKTVKTGKGAGKPGSNSFFIYTGNRLIASPKWSFSAQANYEIPLFGWGTLTPHWDMSYRSKVYLDPSQHDIISQTRYFLHNARIAYSTPNGGVTVAGWVKNLFDTFYKIDVFDLSTQYQSISEVWAGRRTYGVTVSFEW